MYLLPENTLNKHTPNLYYVVFGIIDYRVLQITKFKSYLSQLTADMEIEPII